MNLFQSQMKLTLIQGHLSNDLALGSGQPKSDLIQKTWLHSLSPEMTHGLITAPPEGSPTTDLQFSTGILSLVSNLLLLSGLLIWLLVSSTRLRK